MVYITCGPAKRPHGPDSLCVTENLDDDWLMAQYIKFNLKYFDMKLPIDWDGYFRGVFFRGNKNSGRRGAAYGYANVLKGITINPYLSKDQTIRTLLHEMVHAEQFIVRKTDGDHGRWFKSRCRELTILTKQKYGKIT